MWYPLRPLSGAVFFLIPAASLLFYSASVTLTLQRGETGIDATIQRHAVFGLLNIERLELNGILKAHTQEVQFGPQVMIVAHQGFIEVSRAALDAAAADQLATHINIFLKEPGQNSLVLTQGSPFGFAKGFGYLLLTLFLLSVVTALVPRSDPPQALREDS